MKRQKKDHWWQEIFNENYIKTYIDITNPEQTERQVAFLIKQLRLRKGDRLLDLACGAGRHTLALAQRGYTVTGLDFSSYLLHAARMQAKAMKSTAPFIKGDMRSLPFRSRFDVVLSMFTSFGYFDDEDNVKVLQNIHRALRPDGKLLLDISNTAAHIPKVIREGKQLPDGTYQINQTVALSNGLNITQSSNLDLLRMRWNVTKRWRENKHWQEYTSEVRIFSLPEITSLLMQAGLTIKNTWGDFYGSPLTAQSKHLIILATKRHGNHSGV